MRAFVRFWAPLLGHIWALPTTMLGLAIAVVGGARPVRIGEGPEFAWVWHVERGLLLWLFTHWRFAIGAQTFGAIILVLPGSDPELLKHERCHVRQAFALGPFYLPVYLALSVWAWARGEDCYWGNPLERAAERAALR